MKLERSGGLGLRPPAARERSAFPALLTLARLMRVIVVQTKWTSSTFAEATSNVTKVHDVHVHDDVRSTNIADKKGQTAGAGGEVCADPT